MISTNTLFFRGIAVACALMMVDAAIPAGLRASGHSESKAGIKNNHGYQKIAQSRPLSAREQKASIGRTGNVSLYLAGTAKWDVVYKGVNLVTRNYSTSATDLTFEGGYGIPVSVTRSYSANNYEEGPFGRGWSLSADIRSTAGGLMKSAGAPVRSVPESFKLRHSEQIDPNLPSSYHPPEAVLATDASGKEETIQRDLDGVLTTPAWDTNVVDSHYVKVTQNGIEYDVLDSTTVKTVDGTVYEYTNHGYYDGGITRSDTEESDPEPCNVVKIDSCTDRQGNETTYTYSTGSGNRVSFVKANGTTVEDKLLSVHMPNGHEITFTWGNGSSTPSDRIVSVSDNNDIRTIAYTYNDDDLLETVTTPGGMVTAYAYSQEGHIWHDGNHDNGDNAGNLLTEITDPRGLSTSIYYAMDNTTLLPYTTVDIWAPCVWKVVQPNGTLLYVNNLDTDLGIEEIDNLDFHGAHPTVQERSSSGEVLMAGHLLAEVDGSSGLVVTSMRDLMQQYWQTHSGLNWETWYKLYDRQTQSLVESRSMVLDVTEDYDDNAYANLARDRFGSLPGGPAYNLVVASVTHNFMGNPLVSTVSEKRSYDEGFVNYYTNDKITEYAYWGIDKYYQQKATRTKTGSSSYRYSYTDYYDKDADAGQRGQVKAVYDPKYGDVVLNGDIDPPWRYQVELGGSAIPAATFYNPSNSAQIGYDDKGRSTDVWKLQRIVSGSPQYVQTHTEYGEDDDGSWGQASSVTEDYGSGKINRTTQTLHYTSWGVADQVQDAVGRVFETHFFDLDGKVDYVTKTENNQTISIVDYDYFTSAGAKKGMVKQVVDNLSGITQDIDYCTSGGGIGQVSSTSENRSNSTTDLVEYTYNDAGDRETATYTTASNNTVVRWWYRDYIHVGMPDSYRRAFQTLTMVKWNSSNSSWDIDPEEFHYAYDSAGRLRVAAFAQTPTLTSPISGSGYYGTDTGQHPSSRARAMYEYDPAGRLKSIKHWWDYNYSNGAYTSDALIGETCNYGDYLGLKTDQSFLKQDSGNHGAFANPPDHVEQFGYDSALDYLTSASYDGGSTSTTWSYDAAGNRNDATVVDNLNMATTIGGVSRTYDTMGNTTAIGSTKTLGWDCLNRMLSFGNGTVTKTYKYRADGMRVKKGDIASPSIYTEYAYDGQMPIEEYIYRVSYGVSPLKVIRYAPGARGIDRIERVLFTGSTLIGYPLYDAHGNNVATLKKGTSANTYSWPLGDQRLYDAWGNIRTSNTTGEPNLRHCANLGHLQDDESGLVYMRARYSEPGSGRFISEDPRHQGTNWFTYCANTPVNGVDPRGTVWELLTGSLDEMAEMLNSALSGSMVRGRALQIVNMIDARMAGLGTLLGLGQDRPEGQLILRFVSSMGGKVTDFRFDIAAESIDLSGFARNVFNTTGVGHSWKFEQVFEELLRLGLD